MRCDTRQFWGCKFDELLVVFSWWQVMRNKQQCAEDYGMYPFIADVRQAPAGAGRDSVRGCGHGHESHDEQVAAVNAHDALKYDTLWKSFGD